MKHLLILCLIAIAYGAVVELTPETFDSVVDGSKHVFVEFFAPWCGHCRRFAPVYEELGEVFAMESSVIIAKVNADEHKDLGGRYDVTGFPTLKFFKKGSTDATEFNGDRELNDLVDFVNKHASTNARISEPASAVTILDPENFERIVLDSSKDVLVEFYAPWCGHCKKLAPVWEKLATAFKNDEDVVIASLDADKYKDVGSKYGVSGFPTIIFFSKDNKEGDKYNGGRELNELVGHINQVAGTHRTISGLLDDTVGRHDVLDALAKKFMAATDGLDAMAEEAAKEAAKLHDKHAEWYSRFMRVIAKRGRDWVSKEAERVQSLLAGGSVSSDKVDEFAVRRNVLAAFKD